MVERVHACSMEPAAEVDTDGAAYEPGRNSLDISVSVSTVDGHDRPSSFVASPPLVQTTSVPQIYRTSSLPGGMNERGKNENELSEQTQTSSPVNRRKSTSRSKKKAQYWRNSVAVTNSDYLNQWRPQMMQLIHSQSAGGGGGGGLMRAIPSAPSLDTISEHELVAKFQPTSTSTILSPLVTNQQQADPNMFRYTPTPVQDPARQYLPRPLSRPTTPVPPSLASSRATTPAMLSPVSTSNYDRPLRRESSQAIPLSSDVASQFLPVFVNSETGGLYMFEDGYYIPLLPHQLQTLEESARNAVTQPPVPDKRVQDSHKKRDSVADQHGQRYSRLFQDVPDYQRFVQLLMILFAICCDFVVLLIFGVPALLCSNKVKKANRIGDQHAAKKYSEYTICFSVGGIVFHIILVVIVIVMFLILHFVAHVFGS